MISYALTCANEHRFDGWFRGSGDFDRQVNAGLVTCPACGDDTISKALMAPRVATSRAREKAAQEVHQAMARARQVLGSADKDSAQENAVDGEVLDGTPALLKDAPAPVKAHVEAVRAVRREVEARTENVGQRFAEEARKMHLGEADARPIRGQASLQEAHALDEEGIEVFLLPPLPEDGH